MDTATIASIIAAATPLVYAVIGETITEEAGVVNLSLDGSIMLSAMTGFAAATVSGSVLVGFLAAMLVSMAIAALIAFASIQLRLDQIAVGFVLTLLAADLIKMRIDGPRRYYRLNRRALEYLQAWVGKL